MMTLNAVSYLAPNMFGVYRAMCDQLERGLGFSITLNASAVDALDDAALLRDEFDIGFICGLPLVRLDAQHPHQWDALVAPVLAQPRYHNRPVYFADVIVRAASPYWTLADLRGAAFCYNDPGSNSGVHLLRHYLWQQGYPSRYFRSAILSGAHQRSILRVMAGDADCAAIDSAVLEQALRDDAGLAGRIRVVESVGPCPIPPMFISRRLGDNLRHAIQTLLQKPDAPLQSALDAAGIARLAPVGMADYAVIHAMFNAVSAADYALF
jgi:phosphonate transport system substrate-binding protein